MLYRIGRFLQILGILIVPVGIAGNVAVPNQIPLLTSLAISGMGIAVFTLGWLVQEVGRRK